MTKAVPFFKGQLVKKLGLRYAPDIRFFRDNTIELVENYERQAE